MAGAFKKIPGLASEAGKKGGANKRGYRAPTKRNWEDLMHYLSEDGSDKYIALMEQTDDPRVYSYMFNKIVEFHKARKREISGELNVPITVTFENIKNANKH